MIDAPSIPAQSDIEPASSAGPRWLAISDAARLMGCSEQFARRLCTTQWAAEGLAKVVSRSGGGRAWLICSLADPRLTICPIIGPDLPAASDLGGDQRREMSRRLRIIEDFKAARAAGWDAGKPDAEIVSDFLIHLEREGTTISKSTLYRLAARPAVAPIDGRWLRRRRDQGDDPFLECVVADYLRPVQLPLSECIRRAESLAARHGWKTFGYDTCRRHIQSLPEGVVSKQRYGDAAFNGRSATYIERDYSALASNEIWVADHHEFDVWVKAPDGSLVRPWLTGFLDMASRKLVGWMIFHHAPNQSTILGALRVGIEGHGAPFTAYWDNGKDFDSYALNGRTKLRRKRRQLVDAAYAEGVMKDIGTRVRFALPYNAQAKLIERFFLTVETLFGKTWPTYCGSNPMKRPDDLQAKMERGLAPELADFTAAFATWLEQSYHQSQHEGDGMDGKSPAEVWESKLVEKRVADQRLLDSMLLLRTPPRKVGRNGVVYRGVRYGQHEPQIIERMGREVTLRVDPRHVNSVQVWDTAGRFICLATANRRLPANATEQELREAMADQRRSRRLAMQYRQASMRLTEDVGETIRRRRSSAKSAGNAPPPPGPRGTPTVLTPIRHPIEAQLDAIERAKQLPRRKAVGAEYDIFAGLPELGAPRRRQIDPKRDLLKMVMADDGGCK